MGSEWKSLQLGDICELRAGSVFPPALQGKLTGTYPFVKVSDMNLPANALYIQVANNWINDTEMVKLKAKPFPVGTTIFAKIGEALKANRLRFLIQPTILDNNMMGAIPTENEVDPRFFFYSLSQFDFGEIADGTALPYLTVNGLSKLPVMLPPLSDQHSIAHILGTLDDKIELNRRMNETLEAMARALFKSWFVDFDPVRAKVEGRDTGFPSEISDLFPDEFVDSELGEIPKGWNIGTVQDLGEVICGKTPPTAEKSNYGNDVPFVTIPDMHGKVFINNTGKMLSRKGAMTQRGKFLPPFSICVSCIATPGLVTLTSEACQTNQQINSVIPSDNATSLFSFFSLRGLGERIRTHGAGGSVFLNLNKSQFSSMRILLPPHVACSFQIMMEPLLKKILNNEKENDTLSSLRDTLLPKLISGEIRVGEAEKYLEVVET